MTSHSLSCHGYRFPPEIISHAVWLCRRFCLSFRDVEDLLAERGVTVSYEAEGRGVPQDEAEAVRWYRRAADQGHAAAQYNLGGLYLYAEGRGVPQDEAEATRWFRLAADQGLAAAQYNLGGLYLYAEGRGVPQDEAEATRWFRLAADQGLAAAHYRLGVMYRDGEGVTQDLVAAHMWMSLAAARLSAAGRFTYAQARDLVAKEMTAEQITEAQRRAREWKPAAPQ